MTTSTAIALDDDALWQQFAAATLPPARFGHREHLRVAWLHLQRHDDFAAAAGAFRRALRAYVAAHGAAAKYHETITWAYLALLAARRHAWPELSFDEVVAREPGLLDHRRGTLARLYDLAVLTASPTAAATFVLPGDVLA
jgi:hypothetical protein